MAKGQSRAPSQRQLRVGEELRHALAEVLGRRDMRDPVLRDASVTVTEVRASPDLKRAVAFVVPLGGGDDAPVLAALERASPWLRGQIARLARLKYAPILSFQPDPSFDEAQKVEALLRDVGAQGGGAGEEDAGAGGT